MDPSGFIHVQLGRGDLRVKLQAREGDCGRVVYLVVYAPSGQRLSIAFDDPDQARAVAAGALKVADELLNQTGRWPA